ncbi:CRISPR-associated family protein [Lyngbya aestuarii BL J]|uniref:CRISPR system Cms protein Csm4 n=1 Tax=Lyngbya aestuarii BL J TaxID=1348334 RepID=U7QMS2_9CYAN|nr:type III-A CRISPR-associated RAMP protein Csm4 [Lyngbya aestuarii]ERT07711.1 CRISPR-associated family protein [Lyngbya aestuarii BL J]
MSEWQLYKLNFERNPVHFGELGIGLEETSDFIHSDTLFSAWVSAYARLLGKDAVEELLQQFQAETEPLFRLSSTFIYRQINEETIYYLPRPLKRPVNYPDDDLEFSKAYKKLNYLPLEIWQRWYQGEGWKESDTEELKAKAKAKKGEKIDGELAKAETFNYGEAVQKGKVPKIAVDRTTRATNIYHTNFVYFKENAGLYFIVEFSNPEFKNTFLTILKFLGEEGIGGERSSGAGQFQVESSELTDEWEQVIKFDKGKFHSLISLFWEKSLSESFLEKSSYELLRRGGWISSSPSGSQRRRQSVQMFAEGSVFRVQPKGQLANVTPDGFKVHQIYRSGISLSLSIKALVE